MGHFLEMRNISKQFNENRVLQDINFTADRGEVHAIIGENGAGKIILMKILAGLFLPDTGEIRIDGQVVSIQNPKEAQDLGIAMIYQDISLFQDLNITENVFMRREPLRSNKWLPFIDWNRAHLETHHFLEYFDLAIHEKAMVHTLTIGQQKFVEIIKALSQEAKILIMDEPTAALTEQETEVLFRVINDIKNLGVVIIYISHRIDEIQRIADTVTVLRDGECIETCRTTDLDMNEMIRSMIGKELEDRYPKLKVKPGKEIMRVEDLCCGEILHHINFTIRKGEIIGITGLTGSGGRTLAKVLFGIYGPFKGNIHINGKDFQTMSPYLAIKNGLCFATGVLPEEGLILNASITENITLPNLNRISRMGFIDSSREQEYVSDLIDRLEVVAEGRELTSNQSGGNQKKVILAKWLFTNAKVFIIEEPTSGIDIASKIDIYNIMNEILLSGASIIMISSDLPEIMGMSDTIVVMQNGGIAKMFSSGEATQEEILYYVSGGK